MRYFFRRRIPAFDRLLLVESGSRHLSESLLVLLRCNHDEQVVFDYELRAHRQGVGLEAAGGPLHPALLKFQPPPRAW